MMKTVKKIILMVVCLIFLIVSCEKTPTTPTINSRASQVITQTKSPISTPTIKNSALPTITFTSTATRKPNVPVTEKVNTATSTPAIPPEANLSIHCLDVLTDTLPQPQSSGMLIMQDDHTDELSMMDMSTKMTVPVTFPAGTLAQILVSPKQDYIAYYQILNNINDIVEENLLITDAENQIKISIPWEKNWAGITAWLDNRHLIMSLYDENPIPYPTSLVVVPKPTTLLALNPFTGQKQILKPDYPDIYSSPPWLNWNGWGLTVYDPRLTRVVYPQDNKNTPLSQTNYILWDTTFSRSLASFPVLGGDAFSGPTVPKWYDSGEFFAFAPTISVDGAQDNWPNSEIYIVNRDGQSRQISHLTDYYPWSYIYDFFLSPDGRHIAFWLSHWQEKPQVYSRGGLDLAVVDTSTGQVTNYCIQGANTFQLGDSRNVELPIYWSSNGTQIVVSNSYYDGDKTWLTRNILVDIDKNLATVFSNDKTIYGWVNNP